MQAGCLHFGSQILDRRRRRRHHQPLGPKLVGAPWQSDAIQYIQYLNT